jgi:hypothetical protein
VSEFGSGKAQTCPLCRAEFDDEYVSQANMSKKVYEAVQEKSLLSIQWKYSGRSGGWVSAANWRNGANALPCSVSKFLS